MNTEDNDGLQDFKSFVEDAATHDIEEPKVNNLEVPFMYKRRIRYKNNRKTTRGRNVQHVQENREVIAKTDLGYELHESKVFYSTPDPITGKSVKIKCGKHSVKKSIVVFEKDDLVRIDRVGNRVIHVVKDAKDKESNSEVQVPRNDSGERETTHSLE